METVGQLDEQHPNIFGHGKKHLPEVLRLFFGPGLLEVELSDLGHPVDELEHLLAKGGLDLFGGEGGVFQGVVEKGRHERLGVDLHVGQDHGHR